MALIKCPECGKKVSDKAPACIQCGYPLKSAPKTPVTPKTPDNYLYLKCPKCKKVWKSKNPTLHFISGLVISLTCNDCLKK